MSEAEEIDIETELLILYRDMQGKFSYFQWYKPIQDKDIDIDTAIIKWNAEQIQKGENGRLAELVQDQTVKEVCAYRKKTESIYGLLDDIKQIRRDINDAIDRLDDAADSLRRIEI